MPTVTRRGFFKQTSLTALAVSALSFVPFSGLVASDSAEVEEPGLNPALVSGPVVAHVRDLATGEVSIMSGMQEVIVRDPQLVAKLLKLSH